MPATELQWQAAQHTAGPLPMALRGSGALTVRRVLNRAQGGLCGLCGLTLQIHSRSIDHVIPRAKGGVDRLGNLLIAHRECNMAKSDRAPTGCELIWLLAVNNRLGVEPRQW